MTIAPALKGKSLSHPIVILHGARRPPVADGFWTAAEIVQSDEIRRRVRNEAPWRWVWRHGAAAVCTARADFLPNRFKISVLLRLMSRGSCWICDPTGARCRITPGRLAAFASRWAIDGTRRPWFLHAVRREVRRLASTNAAEPRLNPRGRPVYLRTDLCFELLSGGSVGHIAGVLNHLDAFCQPPVFLTTDHIPTVRSDVETHRLIPDTAFIDFLELPELNFNAAAERQAHRALGEQRPAFVYQRYSINNFTGLKLARSYGVPFVLEFNGSEVWVNRNWGRRLTYEALATEIEDLNIRAADLVVVVSDPIRDELIGRGVAAERILVNPNGVDPERYRPDIDGSEIRRRYGLDGRTVAGFIGTFGRWHGAEVLAEAFGRLLAAHPDCRNRLRLLLIGDGVMMPQVREQLARYGVEDCAVLTGLVPQAEGPAHLAACDVLVSPHVPNPDGTPFFGSPTKLFEYMAMGRGIVASDLDQIGEILEHDRTAWMVRPGDAAALAEGLRVLVEDPARAARLGAAARREVVAKYTWRDHTRRIIEALEGRVALPRAVQNAAA